MLHHSKSVRNNNIPHGIKWEFIEHASPFNPATWWCRLCVLESYYILFEPGGASLNQRSEFFSHCYHQKPQLLVKKWSSNLNLHSKLFLHSSQSQLSFNLVVNMYLCLFICYLLFTPFLSFWWVAFLSWNSSVKVPIFKGHVLLMR